MPLGDVIARLRTGYPEWNDTAPWIWAKDEAGGPINASLHGQVGLVLTCYVQVQSCCNFIGDVILLVCTILTEANRTFWSHVSTFLKGLVITTDVGMVVFLLMASTMCSLP